MWCKASGEGKARRDFQLSRAAAHILRSEFEKDYGEFEKDYGEFEKDYGEFQQDYGEFPPRCASKFPEMRIPLKKVYGKGSLHGLPVPTK